MNRFWVKNEVRRRNPDGSYSVYCRRCGREIIRQNHPVILSVSKCQLCVLKAQGVVNAEDYVLPQYKLASMGFPVPIEYNDEQMAGILLLKDPEDIDPNMLIQASSGTVGTIRSFFRTVGFAISKPVEKIKSVQLATEKRSGLFGPQRGRR